MSDLEQQTDETSDVVFDTASGISLEEQQEILAGINAMSGGNRLVPEATVINAKKKGFLFPMYVNIAAVVLLGLGFIFLFLFHVQADQDIRDSSVSLGLTERKLIQEIRQETSRQLGEKEKEINNIQSKLSAVDTEYRVLQESVETLTEEQQERVTELLAMQEEYRSTLIDIEEEKAKIIEDSRLKEATLRASAEEKVLELSSQIEQSQANLGAAMEELRLLGSEQERASRAESQMNGFYRTLNNQIDNNSLDEASKTLAAMREFLNAPAFQGVRSMEARKQTHLAAISAMEGAISEARILKEMAARGGVIVQPSGSQGQDDVIMALEERYAELDTRYAILTQKASAQETALSALSAQGSDQDRLMTEYLTELNSLRAANWNQQETLNRRDAEIVNLRIDNGSKEDQLKILDTNAITLRTQLQTANETVREREAALTRQRTENSAIVKERDELQDKFNDIEGQYNELLDRMNAAVRAFTGD